MGSVIVDVHAEGWLEPSSQPPPSFLCPRPVRTGVFGRWGVGADRSVMRLMNAASLVSIASCDNIPKTGVAAMYSKKLVIVSCGASSQYVGKLVSARAYRCCRNVKLVEHMA